MATWVEMAVAGAATVATAVIAIRDAMPRRRRQSVHVESSPVGAATSPASREWLLDTVPVEDPVPRRERAASAGRLAIGITGMAIVGAGAVLGISRAFSALFDRLLR